MLALGPEQVRRGGRGVSGLQVRTTLAWQAPPTAKPHAHDKAMNIRQKISQWEGRCGLDADVKAHAPVLSRTVSGDGLGDGLCADASGREPQGKAVLSKAKSLGLDFREARTGPVRKSEPPQNCPNEIATTVPQIKPLVAHSQSSPKVDTDASNCSVKRIITTNGEPKVGCVLDDEVVSKLLPPLADDQEDNMPSGNFYTSRGFWRRLEGDKLLWDKARDSSGELQPPPRKPQRTFQYRGAGDRTQCLAQWDRRLRPKRGGIAQPPSFPPPPCPAGKTNGLSRHKKNRKSFEYEDAVHLTSQQGMLGGEDRRSSGLYHAFSDDSIYEDIVSDSDVTRENPYEDVKFSPTCVQIGRPKPWTVSQRLNPHQAPKLPPKPQTLQYYAGKVERKEPNMVTSPSPSTLVDASKPATPRHTSTQKTQRQPLYVSRIRMIFDAKRGKRVKSQGSVRETEETSGTESDPEDGTRGSRRSVYIQSTLKRRPGYRTLERDLIQLQQQQLFQLFVVVSLRKGSPGNTYSPQITQQFPKFFEKASRNSREAEDRLRVIPMFCFPDAEDWRPSADAPSETFSFVLTGEDGSRWFGYCRKILPSGKGKRLPEVHCIVSRLGCFNLFAKILEEVERRREMSPALVHPFMRSVMEAPFPAPGRTITVKSFLPGSGNEVLTLCRPVDSRLEHVDFESLLQCLSVGRLLQVIASLLLERRVIFIADKLSVLSHCGHAVLALLYPFTWQHTFIPVLPTSMLDITCSPTPFLMGVLAPCLPQLWELPIEEVLIVDLCADKFIVQLGDEDCILPNKLQAALQQVLEEKDDILRQEVGDSSGGQQTELSSLISEAFVRFFVELVGHYPLHMAESASGARELQRDSFRKSHPSRGVRQFLQLFMDTQMFAGFIQDKELRKGAGKGLFESRAAEYLDSCQEPEPSSVNKFLKGLGNKMKFLQIK